MARALTALAQGMLTNKDVKAIFTFKLAGVDYSSYVISYETSFDREFGAASAIFTLNNQDGIFGDGGANKIYVGDVVELFEKFEGDSIEYKKFYGLVEQRSITNASNSKTITLNCLDYLSILQKTDLDLTVEGEIVEVRNETLTPNYLPAPNESLSQLFNFANESIAPQPSPSIRIVEKAVPDKNDTQYDGFEVLYSVGQVKLGVPLNTLNNYDIKANYHYYRTGVYVEDVIQEILTQEDGYGRFLFGEASAQDVIDNHLTDSYLNIEGTTIDGLVANSVAENIEISAFLISDVTAGATSISVDNTDGFPDSGEADVNGDMFSWTYKDSTTFYGIPSTGSLSLKAHTTGDKVNYETNYAIGQAWYFKYNNLVTDLIYKPSDTTTGLTFYKDFVGTKSLEAEYALGSKTFTFTATRSASTPSTYLNGDGEFVINTTSNSPRYTYGYYDTTGYHDAEGILLEEASTNLLINSYVGSTTVVETTSFSTPAGTPRWVGSVSGSGAITTTIDTGSKFLNASGIMKIEVTNAGSSATDIVFESSITNNNVTIQDTVYYTLSFLVKASTGVTIPVVCLDGATKLVNQGLNTSFSATTDWTKISLTFEGDNATDTSSIFSFRLGNLGLYSIWFDTIQVEAKRYSSTYIPSLTSSLTRNQENLSFTSSNNINGLSEGSIFLQLRPIMLYNEQSTDNQRIFDIVIDSNNYVRFEYGTNAQTQLSFKTASASTVRSATSTTMSWDRYSSVIVGGTFTNDDASGNGSINLYENDQWIGSNPIYTVPSGSLPTNVILASASNCKGSHILERIFIYDKVLSTTELITLIENPDTTAQAINFSIQGARIRYLDQRFGRILLDTPLNIATTITCDVDYDFKTLQATGVEINKILFRKRDTEHRLAAINKVRDYVAPNYIIRTNGDDKIWASYLSQKTAEDYELELPIRYNYLEDTDLFTRVVFYGRNDNPTNLMFGDSVDYTTDEEDSYTGYATMLELNYLGAEKSGSMSEWAYAKLPDADKSNLDIEQAGIKFLVDKYIKQDYANQATTGYLVYASPISEAQGKIVLGEVVPKVYINGVQIDNRSHEMVSVPVRIKTRTESVMEGGGKSKSIAITTYYTYTVTFAHRMIVPTEPIYMYDNEGILQYTIAAGDPNMDYTSGIWTIPGIERNDVAEVLSTATYYVMYSSDDLIIDHETAVFKISRRLIPDTDKAVVHATFEYWAIAIAVRDIDLVIDGRRDTQLQLVFYSEPPNGFELATIDLGATYNIQAIDIVAGFFKPDDRRKFDCGFSLNLKYSTDGTNFYEIADETNDVKLKGGENASFEEDVLGSNLEARYIKFALNNVDRLEYEKGRYVVALTEISIYNNIVLRSEAKLTPTTYLNGALSGGEITVTVDDTTSFDASGTAYIGDDEFTYTSKTATTFEGCDGVQAHSDDTRVSQELETDTILYDTDGLLHKMGDRLSKEVKIDSKTLYSQTRLDAVSAAYLQEYYKNHTRLKAEVLFAPHIQVGHTIKVTDTESGIDQNYFVENIQNNNGRYSLTLARYPL